MSDRERAERSRYIEHVAWLRPRTIGHPRRFLLAEAHARKRPLWPFFLAAAALVTVALVVLSAPDEWVGLVLSLVPNIGLLFAWVMAAGSRDDRLNARTSAYFESLQADRRLYREWQLSNRGYRTTPDQLAEEIR